MTLTKPRLWVAGTVVVSLLLVVAGWFLLISPQRAEASELRTQTADTAQQNQVLEGRIAELKAEFAQLPQRKAELEVVRKAMPQDAQLAVLTRSLTATAADTGVTVMSVTPGTLVAQVSAVTTATNGQAAAAADATSESGTAAPAPAPAVGSGVQELPISVVVVGTYPNSVAFLEALQTSLGRDYLVDGLNVVAQQEAAEASGGRPAMANGDITLTITGRVFVLDTPTTATTTTASTTTPTDD